MVNVKTNPAYKQAVIPDCQIEIGLINQVLAGLQQELLSARTGLQVATLSNVADVKSYWSNQVMDITLQISRLQTRLAQTKSRCNVTSNFYSSYCDQTCLDNTLNQAATDCNTGNGSDWSQDSDPTDCYNASVQVITANVAAQNAGGPSSSNPNTSTATSSSSGGFMTTLNSVFGFAKGLFGGTTTTTKPSTGLPPTASSTVIGMTPVLGTTVIILFTGGAVWGIFALIKYASKPGKTAVAAK